MNYSITALGSWLERTGLKTHHLHWEIKRGQMEGGFAQGSSLFELRKLVVDVDKYIDQKDLEILALLERCFKE